MSISVFKHPFNSSLSDKDSLAYQPFSGLACMTLDATLGSDGPASFMATTLYSYSFSLPTLLSSYSQVYKKK